MEKRGQINKKLAVLILVILGIGILLFIIINILTKMLKW
jgi:hypothetical protein